MGPYGQQILKNKNSKLPLLGSIENEVVKEHYLKKLSKELDTSLESVTREINKFQENKKPEKIVAKQQDKRKRQEVFDKKKNINIS